MTEKAKLNKESLEKLFPRLHYDCDLSMLEYKSPIQVRVEQAVKAFNLQVENEVYKVVQNYEINVDKDELIKALQYDRNQYELGYRAGYRKASEVAREIFDDVDEIAYRYLNNADYSAGDMIYDLNELKKKYTEGEK
jgi:hypothetical protein